MSPRRCVVAVLLGVILAACNSIGPEPTPTATPPLLPSAIPASPTVNPVAPIPQGEIIRDSGLGDQGVSDPTMAALPAEGQPSVDAPTLTPGPTQADLPMVVSASDGLALRATFFGAPVRPAPGVLMLPMRGRGRDVWDDVARRLQAAGYSVLTVDLRGSGETGGTEDWMLAADDASAALRLLSQLPGVSPGQVAVVGASTGANLALNACADLPGCGAAVLLSPGQDYHGITTPGAMARFGTHALLIIASENDNNNPADSVTLDSLAAGDHQLVIYPAAGHGTDMLAAQLDLPDVIVNWLLAHVPPPAP